MFRSTSKYVGMNVTTANTRQKILVFDDNELVRKTIVLTLQSAQYEVAEASDGIVGLKAVAEAPFDLVIKDILMPNMEGIETIRELRRRIHFSDSVNSHWPSPASPLVPQAVLARMLSPLQGCLRGLFRCRINPGIRFHQTVPGGLWLWFHWFIHERSPLDRRAADGQAVDQ